MPNQWSQASLGWGAVNPEADWLTYIGETNGVANPVPQEKRAYYGIMQLEPSLVMALLEIYSDQTGLALAEDVWAASLSPQSMPDWVRGMFQDCQMSHASFEKAVHYLSHNHAVWESEADVQPLEIAVVFSQTTFDRLRSALDAQGRVSDAAGMKLLDFSTVQDRDIYDRERLNLKKDLSSVSDDSVPVSTAFPSWSDATEATSLQGDEVIMAIIDDGIAFAHERFRLGATETRFEYFWAMDGITPVSHNSYAVADGCMLRKSDIDALLKRHDFAEEEDLYRACGLLDFAQPGRQALRFAKTHGSHVLDIATGYEYRDPEERKQAMKRPIIGVQLPARVVGDTSGAYSPPYIQDALDRIFYNAIELAERIAVSRTKSVTYLPLILNFSFGVFAGPLDGGGSVERMIEVFIDRYRALPGNPICEVTLPSGNFYRENCGAYYKAGMTGSMASLNLRLLPDDKTANFVQIWSPERLVGKAHMTFSAGVDNIDVSGVPAGIRASVIPPQSAADTVRWTEPGKILQWERDGVVLARLYHRIVPRPNNRVRDQIVLATRATETESLYDPRCAPGLWQISLRNETLPMGSLVECLVQRGDAIPGQDFKSRQAYFELPLADIPHAVNFETHPKIPSGGYPTKSRFIMRQGPFNAYAGSDKPVVVAGYRLSDGSPAWYSSGGPTQERPLGPDLAAVSETSTVLRGVLAAGTKSGTVMTQNGTSVAAPRAARAIADAIAAGSSTPVQTVLDKIQQDESQGIRGPHGPYRTPQPYRAGFGRLVPDNTDRFPKRMEF